MHTFCSSLNSRPQWQFCQIIIGLDTSPSSPAPQGVMIGDVDEGE